MTDDPRLATTGTDGSSGSADEVTQTDVNRDRPMGMLPRGRAKEEATEEDRELVVDIAESFFPNKEHIAQLERNQQQFWIPFATRMLRGTEFDQLVVKFGDVLTPGVDAQIDDILERQQFDFANERRRIALDAVDRAEKKGNRKQRREEEREKRLQKIRIFGEEWEVRRQERLTNLGNRALREKVVLAMAVVVFLLALVLCVLGLLSHRGYVGGSGGGLAVIILGVLFRQVRHDQRHGMVEMRSHEASRQQDDHDSR